MKVVFMGTPIFAVPTLRALINSHEVIAVITQPDRQKGRGKKIQTSLVKDIAIEHRIPVLQPEKIRESAFVESLNQYKADVYVVVAYGQKLPESILNQPKYGCINVHGSLLPQYRGAAPIQWAVVNGESMTGVTIMYMDKGIDTGDMILKIEIPIGAGDTSGDVLDAMSEIGAAALLDALESIEKGTAIREKQDNAQSSNAPQLTKQTGHIIWSRSSESIVNLIRGLNPWPSAYTSYDGETMKIWKAVKMSVSPQGKAGEIVEVLPKEGFVVRTGDGSILVSEIQMTNGKRMCVSEYLKGNKIKEHIVLE